MKRLTIVPKSLRNLSGGLMAGAIVVAGAAYGQDATTTTPPPASKGAGAAALENNPTSFLKEAAQGNDAEIAMAEIAQRNAQNPQVKQLAEQLRTDHQQANEQLKPIAETHGVSLNQSMNAKHEATMHQMQQLSGAQFDRAYVEDQLRDHQKDIAQYQLVARESQDPAVRNYAKQMLPKLREHLQLAERAARAIGMDDATISSILKRSPEGVGGTSDTGGSQSGQMRKQGSY